MGSHTLKDQCIIDTRIFFELIGWGADIPKRFGAPYVATALHISLIVQRRNRSERGNKGRTIIICDQQEEFDRKVSELISTPPAWTDQYYDYSKGDRLDQIIDTAYFVRSHHASLVQVADLVAFVFRRYAELRDLGSAERFSGEKSRIQSWISIIRPRLAPGRFVLPPVEDPLFQLYRDLYPASLRDLM